MQVELSRIQTLARVAWNSGTEKIEKMNALLETFQTLQHKTRDNESLGEFVRIAFKMLPLAGLYCYLEWEADEEDEETEAGKTYKKTVAEALAADVRPDLQIIAEDSDRYAIFEVFTALSGMWDGEESGIVYETAKEAALIIKDLATKMGKRDLWTGYTARGLIDAFVEDGPISESQRGKVLIGMMLILKLNHCEVRLERLAKSIKTALEFSPEALSESDRKKLLRYHKLLMDEREGYIHQRILSHYLREVLITEENLRSVYGMSVLEFLDDVINRENAAEPVYKAYKKIYGRGVNEEGLRIIEGSNAEDYVKRWFRWFRVYYSAWEEVRSGISEEEFFDNLEERVNASGEYPFRETKILDIPSRYLPEIADHVIASSWDFERFFEILGTNNYFHAERSEYNIKNRRYYWNDEILGPGFIEKHRAVYDEFVNRPDVDENQLVKVYFNTHLKYVVDIRRVVEDVANRTNGLVGPAFRNYPFSMIVLKKQDLIHNNVILMPEELFAEYNGEYIFEFAGDEDSDITTYRISQALQITRQMARYDNGDTVRGVVSTVSKRTGRDDYAECMIQVIPLESETDMGSQLEKAADWLRSIRKSGRFIPAEDTNGGPMENNVYCIAPRKEGRSEEFDALILDAVTALCSRDVAISHEAGLNPEAPVSSEETLKEFFKRFRYDWLTDLNENRFTWSDGSKKAVNSGKADASEKETESGNQSSFVGDAARDAAEKISSSDISLGMRVYVYLNTAIKRHVPLDEFLRMSGFSKGNIADPINPEYLYNNIFIPGVFIGNEDGQGTFRICDSFGIACDYRFTCRRTINGKEDAVYKLEINGIDHDKKEIRVGRVFLLKRGDTDPFKIIKNKIYNLKPVKDTKELLPMISEVRDLIKASGIDFLTPARMDIIANLSSELFIRRKYSYESWRNFTELFGSGKDNPFTHRDEAIDWISERNLEYCRNNAKVFLENSGDMQPEEVIYIFNNTHLTFGITKDELYDALCERHSITRDNLEARYKRYLG